jgi:hypothetical protein
VQVIRNLLRHIGLGSGGRDVEVPAQRQGSEGG